MSPAVPTHLAPRHEALVDPALAVVTRFLDEARARGEKWTAATRMVLALLVVCRSAILASAQLRAGSPREWTLVGICALSAIYSWRVMRGVDRGTFLARSLWTSIAADAVLIFGGILVTVVAPMPGYAGVLRSPELGLVYVGLGATALRLSARLVLLGAALNAFFLVVLVAIDPYPMRVNFGPLVATSVIYFCTAGLIAFALARRVERLVRDGARAALNAERARQHLGAYISAELAAEALTHDQLNLVGERREVAVLFSDLRGFTRYAERLAPEQLVRELNAYLNDMLPIIRREGGVVDKYIGDSIMVVFGIPQTRADDAARAIRAARGMQKALRAHNQTRVAAGLAPLAQGIGVHAGSVVAGNIGTRERLQYTVVGDVVNLASRLESATKEHGHAVLVSLDAVTAARRSGADLPPLRELGPIEIRGRQQPLAVACFIDEGVSVEMTVGGHSTPRVDQPG